MADKKSINIVSFSIPYPPNTGGLIDVFYKVRAFTEAGVDVYLHCFRYDRIPAEELEDICKSVTYYDRNVGPISKISAIPYIVKSRLTDLLVDNLLKNDYPIIFEGLHTCYYLDDPRLKDRFKIYRESNIEHHYYYHLGNSTRSFKKKIFYYLESIKLKFYQKQLRYSDLILGVSMKDTEYLKKHFPNNKVVYMPCFHGNRSITSQTGKGKYVLYTGNLSVEENILAANTLIDNIFSKTDITCIIAGLNPDDSIRNRVVKYDNIRLIANPAIDEMNDLIANAHINMMITKQSTGLKLKLLNVLYQGRFAIVNSKMCSGTNLKDISLVADNTDDMISKMMDYFQKEFTEEDIAKRKSVLDEIYNDKKNINTLIQLAIAN